MDRDLEELSIPELEEAIELDYYTQFEILKPTDNVVLDDPLDYFEGKASYSVTGYEKRVDREENTWKFVVTDWH